MKPTIERLVKKSRYKASGDAYDKTLGRFMQAVDNHKKQQSTQTKSNSSSTIMRMTKVAAVVIFVAVLIGLHQFRISIDGTSIVWADVAERLEEVRSFKARAHRVFTEVGKDEPILKCDVVRYFSPVHGSMEMQYIDGKLGMLSYGLFSEKLIIFVLPQSKQYFRLKINKEILSIIEYINHANPDGIMKLFGSERSIRLGYREIDGVITEGFEVKDVKVFSSIPRFLFQFKNMDMRVWVNTETLLPVEAEMEGLVGKGLLTGFKDLYGKEVVYDFEYDVEIDESIFEPNIPDDYTLIDPANMAQKAELIMLGIIPCSATIITYKHVRRRRKISNTANSPHE